MYTPDTLKAIHEKYPADVSERRLVHGQQHPARHRPERRRGDAAATRQRVRRDRQRRHALLAEHRDQDPDAGGRRSSRTFEPRVLHQVQLPPEVRDPLMQGFTGAVELAGGHGLRRVPRLPRLDGRRQDRHRAGHGQDRHGAVRRHGAGRSARSTWVGRARAVGLRCHGGGAGDPPRAAVTRRSRAGARRRARRRAVVARARAWSTTRTEHRTDGRLRHPEGRSCRRARPARCAATRPRRGAISTSCCVGCVVAIACLGALMVYSATRGPTPPYSLTFFEKQALYVGIGLGRARRRDAGGLPRLPRLVAVHLLRRVRPARARRVTGRVRRARARSRGSSSAASSCSRPRSPRSR